MVSSIAQCDLWQNGLYFQAMLISTTAQKKREAVENRIIIEDVLE